jgi:hypothetical protein
LYRRAETTANMKASSNAPGGKPLRTSTERSSSLQAARQNENPARGR